MCPAGYLSVNLGLEGTLTATNLTGDPWVVTGIITLTSSAPDLVVPVAFYVPGHGSTRVPGLFDVWRPMGWYSAELLLRRDAPGADLCRLEVAGGVGKRLIYPWMVYNSRWVK